VKHVTCQRRVFERGHTAKYLCAICECDCVGQRLRWRLGLAMLWLCANPILESDPIMDA